MCIYVRASTQFDVGDKQPRSAGGVQRLTLAVPCQALCRTWPGGSYCCWSQNRTLPDWLLPKVHKSRVCHLLAGQVLLESSRMGAGWNLPRGSTRNGWEAIGFLDWCSFLGSEHLPAQAVRCWPAQAPKGSFSGWNGDGLLHGLWEGAPIVGCGSLTKQSLRGCCPGIYLCGLF